MVGASLPEAPVVACDVSDHLVLIREVHLPDQGPITKNPHSSLALPLRRRSTLCCGLYRTDTSGDCSLADASNRLGGRRRSGLTACWGAQSTLGHVVRGASSDWVSIISFRYLEYQGLTFRMLSNGFFCSLCNAP